MSLDVTLAKRIWIPGGICTVFQRTFGRPAAGLCDSKASSVFGARTTIIVLPSAAGKLRQAERAVCMRRLLCIHKRGRRR